MIYYADDELVIRTMKETDGPDFVEGFTAQGWNPDIAVYRMRMKDEAEGKCVTLTAEYHGHPAGSVYVYLTPHDGPFKEKGWPEIHDFNVLKKYQRKGIGSKLMDVAEQIAGKYADTVCLGVGLHDGYGSAQRMYAKRGYVPDGSGVWYQGKQCEQYETVCTVDDDLQLFLSKKLKRKRPSLRFALITLFLTFAKIGLFTFGGGYAMLSVIEHICVTQKQWITHDDLTQVTVIAESTPGPIAVNCATFVGYRQKGFLGAVAATLGVIFPSFVIIFLISLFLDRFLEIAWVSSAFKGIRVAVGILIVDVAVRMIRKMPKDKLRIAVLVCSCLAMLLINIFSWKISTIILLLAAALISLSAFLIRSRLSGKGGELS